MAFLHGVSILSLLTGPRPVRAIPTSFVGLVGTAPVHHVTSPPALSVPTLVASDVDAPKFGPKLAGYSIPSALLRLKGAAAVINVFDPTVHKTDVAVATYAIDSTTRRLVLPHGDLVSATVTTMADGACALGTDYTIDRVKGIVTTVAGGNLAAATQAKVAYSRANPAAVTSAEIIGTVSVGGVRSGIQALLDAKSRTGATPKVLIAPGYSATRSVADALLALTGPKKLRAIALADVPVGTTRDQAITGRASAAPVDLRISDERLLYCYPYHRTSAGDLEPYSQHLAGVIQNTDAELGFWYSPSNKKMQGVADAELPLTASYSDENCDVNLLNAQGFVTSFATDGDGLVTWGNRSSAFPGSADITTFVSVLRTRDVVEQMLEYFSAKVADLPITDVWVKDVLGNVNAQVRSLINRGALAPGSVALFEPAKNPPVEMAAGKVRFTVRHCPPPPAENITWESVVDTTLLVAAG